MSRKVNLTPAVARISGSISSIAQTIAGFSTSVFREFAEHAQRLNATVTTDGVDAMEAPLVVATYTVAGLPAASAWTRGLVYVSNETGGATLAFSDGTNWRRVQDRAVVS